MQLKQFSKKALYKQVRVDIAHRIGTGEWNR